MRSGPRLEPSIDALHGEFGLLHLHGATHRLVQLVVRQLASLFDHVAGDQFAFAAQRVAHTGLVDHVFLFGLLVLISRAVLAHFQLVQEVEELEKQLGDVDAAQKLFGRLAVEFFDSS